jgi:membrane protease YdiL (CAAX protease family)
MENIPNRVPFHMRSPGNQLIASILVILVMGTVLFMAAIYAGSHIFNVDASILDSPAKNPGSNEIGFIKYSLAAQDISFFIVPVLIILWKINPGYDRNVFSFSSISTVDFIMVTILALCAFPVTSLAGELNSKLAFPDKLHGIEEWIREKEDYADETISLIMSVQSFGGMLLNLLLVAFLPAVSEELIFRGVFQKLLQRISGSGNIAVWITAVFFSAIHFQFFGFLPRLILGLIFGYLFLWSGSLWLPILAHLINNAVPVAGAFVKGWDVINKPSSYDTGRQLIYAVVPILVGLLIMHWFRNRTQDSKMDGSV